MKAETKKKLNSLATTLSTKFGGEIINVENFLTIAKLEADKLGLRMHYNTIRDNRTYLESRVKFVIQTSNDMISDLATKQEVKDVEVTPMKIKIYYNDGSSQNFIPEVKVEVKKPEQEQSWTGLFDYRPDKKIFIRRGTHKGCEITDINDVIAQFRTFHHVLSWIDYQLSPSIISKLKFDIDTERDIKCLEDFRRFILRKKNSK